MSEGPMLSGDIEKIASQSAGGWKLAINAPESMKEVIRQLIGTERKVLYNITFDYVCEIDQPEKQKPGRPKKAAE